MMMKEKLSKEQRELFSEAQRYSERGDRAGTLQALKKLVAVAPHIGIIRASLGNEYWDIGDVKSAKIEFLEAVNLSPDSEKISLGFFHFLWGCGDTDGAFEEMKRFVQNRKSEEYEGILKAINNAYASIDASE